jgi:uncharacterized protein YdbL (DUF1318 family)
MVNKEKEFNNQFKTTGRSGEQKNGRLAQLKNHNTQAGETPNEYINKKED